MGVWKQMKVPIPNVHQDPLSNIFLIQLKRKYTVDFQPLVEITDNLKGFTNIQLQMKQQRAPLIACWKENPHLWSSLRWTLQHQRKKIPQVTQLKMPIRVLPLEWRRSNGTGPLSPPSSSRNWKGPSGRPTILTSSWGRNWLPGSAYLSPGYRLLKNHIF